MDLMMPGMDGMEATKRIMARHPTPVLFLSPYFGTHGNYSRARATAPGARAPARQPPPVLFPSPYVGTEANSARPEATPAGALDTGGKPALMPDWRWRNA